MERKIIKVAQVIGIANNGGVESIIWNYYRHIDRERIQFDFLVESESKIINKDEIEKLGGRLIIIPSYKNPLLYMKKLKKIFEQNKYDIVHSNMNALSVFTLKAAKKANIKVRIAHSHSTSNKKEYIKNIIKNILKLFSRKYATNFFACSEVAGRWLFGNKQFNSGKVVIIRNGIELNRFYYNPIKRDELRNKFNLTGNFVIGTVGRLVTQKNHIFLLNVFKKVLIEKKESKLVIIGDGPEKDKLIDHSLKLGINDSVLFLDAVKNIYDYYNIMDCFAFPSLYEGLGMTAVEAQVNGLRALVSNDVPIDVKINENTIFLDLIENVWAERIIDGNFVRDKNIDCSKFDIDKCAEKLTKLYLEMVTD